MFCDGCGAAVQPGQAFCSQCGKQILGPVAVTSARLGRVHQHAHLLGILWLAVSAFNAVAGLILLVLGTSLFPHLRELKGTPPDVPVEFLTSLFTAIAVLILAKAACGFFAGWGLMRPEPWARILALVLAFISLINIPFGTAIGVYTLWVLLPGDSQREYEAMVTAAAA